MQCGHSDTSLMEGLIKFENRLSTINTASSLSSFIHSHTTRRFYSETKIRVQPTSTARRQLHATRGSRRLLAGRPARSDKQPLTKDVVVLLQILTIMFRTQSLMGKAISIC